MSHVTNGHGDWPATGRDIAKLQGHIVEQAEAVRDVARAVRHLADEVTDLRAASVPGLRSSWAYQAVIVGVIAGFVGGVTGVVATKFSGPQTAAAEVHR